MNRVFHFLQRAFFPSGCSNARLERLHAARRRKVCCHAICRLLVQTSTPRRALTYRCICRHSTTRWTDQTGWSRLADTAISLLLPRPSQVSHCSRISPKMLVSHLHVLLYMTRVLLRQSWRCNVIISLFTMGLPLPPQGVLQSRSPVGPRRTAHLPLLSILINHVKMTRGTK